VQCPECGFINLAGVKSCVECASLLESRCPRCGFANPVRAKFCGECGSALAGKVVERAEGGAESIDGAFHAMPPARRVVAGAERRQLTVMFCDLVGSTPLAEKLDPEEFREIVRAYQELCGEITHRFDGYVARYLGDGLLIYFGFPVAHEEDAQRAVRTGLEIVAALPQLNGRLRKTMEVLHDSPLRVRVGIHTGLVVAGEMGAGGDRDPMGIIGETPNIAARLQGIAEPNSVLISTTTYRLVQGFFECRDLGTPSLKGISAPMAVYQILEESDARSRLEVAAAKGLTSLVGRKQELTTLLACWRQVQAGNGGVVLLSGEAGIGKSRLLLALKEHVTDEPHTWLECHCSPYHQNSALHPTIDLLWRGLLFKRIDTPQVKLEKLERALVHYGLPLEEAAPLFAALLSLPLPKDRYTPLNLTPQRQRQKILEMLRVWLAKAAERAPVIGIVEDLQWADPSTLEALTLFMQQVAGARILIMLTFRPDFSVPWQFASSTTHLTLGRLDDDEVEKMVLQVARGKELPGGIIKQVVRKTDGIPLFVEELTKMVLESSVRAEGTTSRRPLPLTIPTTLHDALMARLDRLDMAREVAQLGATLGREFSYELIQAVSSEEEQTLQRGLMTLVEAELLYQHGTPPQATYLFKHALIQEAAYQSLLKRKRQQYHRQIAHVLEARFPELAETQPELVAQHFTEANALELAIPYWRRAGRSAVERSAHTEACHHFLQGLELLKALPETLERAQQELALQVALGGPLIATQGYGAPEVERCYARALALCRQIGETPRLLRVLLGMEAFYFIRAQLHTAHQVAEQCLALARQQENPLQLLQAHWTLGQTLFHLGEFTAAQKCVEQGIALYTPALHQPQTLQDPGVMCLAYASLGQLCLGYADRALQRSREMLTLARDLAHRFSLAFALNIAGTVHVMLGEWQQAQDLSTEAMKLSAEQGFPVWLAYGRILSGWIGVQQGQGEKALTELRRGIAAWEATGAEVSRTFFLALLGQAYGKLGHIEDGIKTVNEGLTMVERYEERYCVVELWRLKGELSLQSGVRSPESQEENQKAKGKSQESKIPNTQHPTPSTQSEAEACFHQALSIAHHQQARTFGLRAAISFARLLKMQGKNAQARQLLTGVSEWFTEGFATADLQRARAMIAQLS